MNNRSYLLVFLI